MGSVHKSDFLFYAQNGLLYAFHFLLAFTCGDNRIVIVIRQLLIEFRIETMCVLFFGDIHVKLIQIASKVL